ncbi:MAG TPA: hypothetical protein VI997_09605 [Candidatus Thermoplasmatota archaeon]|nr:hypothetical protein [Candidatus Thermoplasmatota archaeon]
METRRCSSCAQEKTIRGVWYILPPKGAPREFVCEACMARLVPVPA